jgi:hypothetical protein
MQPAPQLFKKGELRSQVFGIPVTEEDLFAWAIKHNTKEGKSNRTRRDGAWRAICSRLPPNHRRIATVRDASHSISLCFVIGNNFNSKEIELSQDVEHIKLLFDAIDMDKSPGWFYMCEA